MITSMRRCVACDDLWPWPISSRSFDLDFENRLRSVMFSVLDRLFFWLGIQYDPIVWVIMRRRGVSSERRRSSCSSFTKLSGKSLYFLVEIHLKHFSCVSLLTASTFPWWGHQMESFSALLALCVGNSLFTGEFPAQRAVTRSFDLPLDRRLSKQWWGWWFETPSIPLIRHCNAYVYFVWSWEHFWFSAIETNKYI